MYVFSLLVAVGFVVIFGSSQLGQALRFVEEPNSIVALRNSQVSLNCTATAGQTSSSPTRVFWRKDGVRVRPNSNVLVLSSGHLLLRQFRGRKGPQNDEGVYQCFASNEEGTIASRKARVRLAVLSRAFKEWPKNKTVLEGETARFACQSRRALPEPSVIWQKDGQTISPGRRHIVLPNGVLQILKVQQSDKGKYNCIITNIAKTRTSVSGWLQVRQELQPVPNPLHLTVMPGNTSAISGHQVIMECIATGLPVPSVQWKRVGKSSHHNLDATSVNTGSSNLQISSVSVRDQGEYLCVISGGGKTITKSVYLFVKEPPHFVRIPPANGVVVIGKTVKLTCSATGSPMPRITWLKDGKVITLNKRYIINNNGLNRDLTIIGVSNSDAGLYQCFAENALGSTQSSSRVIVRRSAINVAPPRDLQAVAISASTLRITWKPPFGYPDVVAYGVYFKVADNSSSHPRSYVSNNTSFILTGLQGYTYYEIYVSPFYDKHGKGMESQVIKIRTLEGKPTSPPTNVLLTSNTPDSIDVHWIPPPKRYCHGIITNYIIRYSPKDLSSSTKIIQVSSAVNQRTVSGLTKGKTYRFQLAAATSIGIGPFSSTQFLTVTSQNHTVISAPNVSISVINSTVLKVIWQKPSYGGDNVQQYRLSYIKDSVPFESYGPLNLSKHDNEFLITDLSADTRYVIRLMAWDGAKLGQPSLENAQTEVGTLTVPGIQSSVGAKCHATGPTTLWISWEKVLSPRRIAQYKLWYQVKGNLNHATIKNKVVTSGYHTYLESLIPGKTYHVNIQPLGSDGKVIAKHFGSTIECSTPESEPSSPPRNIQFKVKSETTLDLNWEPPAKPNGRITNYIIAYSTNKDLPDDEWDTKTETVLTNFFHRLEQLVDSNLPGLKYNTEYYIKIKAGNKQGYGPYSKPIKVLMVLSNSAESKDTLKLSFKYVSRTVVEIKWNYPGNSNGKPVQYRVIYTTNSQLPHSKWFLMPVVVHPWSPKSERSVSVQLANLSANQTYFVKVQADYGNMYGPWSSQLEIPMKENHLGRGKNQSNTNSGATSSDSRSKNNSEKEDFDVKLGIIIGCVISAFCVVVLVLFIIWRCPCRFGKSQAPETKKNGIPNGSTPGVPNGYSLSTSHQSMVSNRLANTYEESSGGSSIGSGMCQCRCTCSAGRWPTLPTMQSRPNNQTGNGRIITGNGHLVTPSDVPPKTSNPYSMKGETRKVMNGYSSQEPPVPLQMFAVQDNGKVLVGTKQIPHPKSISVEV